MELASRHAPARIVGPAGRPQAFSLSLLPLLLPLPLSLNEEAPMSLSRRKPSSRHSLFHFYGTIGLAALVGIGTYCAAPRIQEPLALLYARVIRSAHLKPPTPVHIASLEQDVATFNAEAAKVGNTSDECFPLHIRVLNRIGILYLQCPEAAYEKDGESVRISDNFSAPAAIARRYNFWRRIYSLWGKDQYVMHLSEYPEVVVEAYDVSRLGDQLGPVAKGALVKRIAKSERQLYRNLFLSMYKLRDHEELFTPAMRRLAASMRHIGARDKYLVAAHTLRLQRGQRDFIAQGLTVAPKYLPAIETEFKAQGIPTEITRLAFVESSFNLKAHSKVGASGVYQIMPATGRQYLKMFNGIDERNDPIKASRAAAKLLKLNYKITGSWPLAITAYNHGVGGIKRAIHAVGSDKIIDLINRYHGSSFGFASKNFYASFLGVLATLKDRDRLFPEVPKVQPITFQLVRLTRPTTVAALKKKFRLTTFTILEFNPDLSPHLVRSRWASLPRGYVIKVPVPKVGLAATSRVPNS